MTTATRSRKKKSRVVPNSTVVSRLNKMSEDSDRRAIKGGWKTAKSIKLSKETAALWERAKLPSGPHSPHVHPFCVGLSGGDKYGVEYKAGFAARVIIPEGVELSPYELLWGLIRDAEYHLENLRCRLNNTIEADRKAAEGGAK